MLHFSITSLHCVFNFLANITSSLIYICLFVSSELRGFLQLNPLTDLCSTKVNEVREGKTAEFSLGCQNSQYSCDVTRPPEDTEKSERNQEERAPLSHRLPLGNSFCLFDRRGIRLLLVFTSKDVCYSIGQNGSNTNDIYSNKRVQC